MSLDTLRNYWLVAATADVNIMDPFGIPGLILATPAKKVHIAGNRAVIRYQVQNVYLMNNFPSNPDYLVAITVQKGGVPVEKWFIPNCRVVGTMVSPSEGSFTFHSDSFKTVNSRYFQ